MGHNRGPGLFLEAVLNVFTHGLWWHTEQPLLPAILKNKRYGLNQILACFVLSFALTICPRNFGAVGNIPFPVLLDDRRKLFHSVRLASLYWLPKHGQVGLCFNNELYPSNNAQMVLASKREIGFPERRRCPMTTVLLVSLPNRYVQLLQLLRRHLAWCAHERILRILVHREGDDLPDVWFVR